MREIEDIRAAVQQLPETFTDADLARIGVTPEELDRLVDHDMTLDFDDYDAQRASEAGPAGVDGDRSTRSVGTEAAGLVEVDEQCREDETVWLRERPGEPLHEHLAQSARAARGADDELAWSREAPAVEERLPQARVVENDLDDCLGL